MSLKHCTFTGLDEKFSMEDLEFLSQRYSFLEWGILYSTSENPNLSANRYPSQKWLEHHIDEISAIIEKTGVSLSLHVCGKEVNNLISQKDTFINFLLPYFNRVQINFRYKPKQKESLIELFNNNPETYFITQHHQANLLLVNDMAEIENHQILFDKSGGKGILEGEWPNPIEKKLCGYAGGLGPDNIEDQINKISATTQNKNYWIDMETQIRTEEWLDYQKCLSVAKQVSPFIA